LKNSLNACQDVYGKTEAEILKMFSLEFKIEKKDDFYTLSQNGKYVDSGKNLKKLQFKALTTEQIKSDFTSYVLNKNLVSTKYRNIKTLNGYPFDIAKSALQKWIRRGKKEEAQKIACELDLFRFFFWRGKCLDKLLQSDKSYSFRGYRIIFPQCFPHFRRSFRKMEKRKGEPFF
jgi:hypothetical protein